MKSPSSILVVGSINTDMVVRSNKLPVPGETVLGDQFIMNPGGKGANQAVAAAQLGGSVKMLGRVGDDIFGNASIENLRKYGVLADSIIIDDSSPSGIALIMVDSEGENSISVALGANGQLSPADIIESNELILSAGYILVQLETPMETVIQLLSSAADHTITLLNPAPAQSLPEALFVDIDIITPNETEAAILTGVKVTDESSAHEASIVLQSKGVKTVIITMGKAGAYVASETYQGMIAAPTVVPVDTTAAGDTFNGALVVALSQGKNMYDAVVFANKAAALSTTKFGAQQSIPSLEDVMPLPQ